MNVLVQKLEKLGKRVSYQEYRKRNYEKNKVLFQHYERLTRDELIIEYADKKSKYEYQKHYLLGIAFLFFPCIIAANGLQGSFEKKLNGMTATSVELIGLINAFQVLGIAIWGILTIGFICYLSFSLKDIQKEYKDVLMIEEIKKERKEEENEK